MNGGQSTPSTNGLFLGVAATDPANGLIGDLRVVSTFGFLSGFFDLRFLVNWFFLTIFGVDKATGFSPDHEAINTNRMLGAVIYLGRFRW